jgi:hypothetical protein
MWYECCTVTWNTRWSDKLAEVLSNRYVTIVDHQAHNNFRNLLSVNSWSTLVYDSYWQRKAGKDAHSYICILSCPHGDSVYVRHDH